MVADGLTLPAPRPKNQNTRTRLIGVRRWERIEEQEVVLLRARISMAMCRVVAA